MKKRIKSTLEFERERNTFLLRAFRESIAAQSRISLNKAFKIAAEAPAPRFWVSEARAAAVIGKMLSGEDPTEGMHPEKREMYREMFSRFLALREENPGEPISELCFRVVNGEAPRSYMSWHRARVLIYKEKSRLRGERGRNGR
ncbi:MAG: hypothetical protein K2G52_04450 [Muribaculaceae bacterium]|nr:hypothetical protein [Muribaculaceae bacterium]